MFGWVQSPAIMIISGIAPKQCCRCKEKAPYLIIFGETAVQCIWWTGAVEQFRDPQLQATTKLNQAKLCWYIVQVCIRYCMEWKAGWASTDTVRSHLSYIGHWIANQTAIYFTAKSRGPNYFRPLWQEDLLADKTNIFGKDTVCCGQYLVKLLP